MIMSWARHVELDKHNLESMWVKKFDNEDERDWKEETVQGKW